MIGLMGFFYISNETSTIVIQLSKLGQQKVVYMIDDSLWIHQLEVEHMTSYNSREKYSCNNMVQY